VKLRLLAFAASTFLLALPAHAQFSGARIEGRLAYESVEATIETGDPTDTDDSESAISYGGEVGYDLQLGQLVVGAYAGLEGSNLRTCEEVFGNDEGCIGQGRNLYVGARAGFSPLPRVLLYAKGGYSNGSVDVDYDGGGSGFGDFEISESFDGYHLGVGGEVAVAAGLYGRIEYVHTDYGDFRFDPTTFGKVDRGQVMVGLGLRF
jgi:outer membrane immunogenic protein